MQFLVLGNDRPGSEARERRLALRGEHIALAKRMIADGHLLYGAALLDEKGAMCGSALVMEFDSRAAVDRYLEEEPYLTGDVWERVEVTPCQVGPMFLAEPERA
jgi:uncharacterized protein YciI